MPNKTDAESLAHLAESGLCSDVRMPGFDRMLARNLPGAQNRLVRIAADLSYYIRGFMKTFEWETPAGEDIILDGLMCRLRVGQSKPCAILLPTH